MNLVADRVLILSDGSTHKTPDNFPIHIRDVEILTRKYEKEKPKSDLRCNLSHFVIDTEELSNVSSEHVLQDNSAQDISCNLTSCSSTEELYQASLSEEDFKSLLKSHTLGDVMVDFC